MTGVEAVTILLNLVFGVVLIAVAWWVAGIHTALTRLAVDLGARHLERSAERAAEKRRREAHQKQFSQWLAETATTLNKLHDLGEKRGEADDTMVMSSTSAPTALPPTVREPRPSNADALPPTDSTGDRLNDSDADTLCWTAPSSSRTLVGVGITTLNESKHGPRRAQPIAHALGKPGS